MVQTHVLGWFTKRMQVALGCWVESGGGAPVGAILAVCVAAAAMEGIEQLHGGCLVYSDP